MGIGNDVLLTDTSDDAADDNWSDKNEDDLAVYATSTVKHHKRCDT
jgi:hypothetical protein